MRTDNAAQPAPILVAVADAILHPEATHLAAATGRAIIDSAGPDDVARHFSRAFAVLVDDDSAAALAALPPREGVFLVRGEGAGKHGEVPEGISSAFVLPAEAAGLLTALGKLTLAAGEPVRSTATGGGSGAVLAFVGAAGGAGTSTLAAAVARSAGTDVTHGTAPPVVVDAHLYSGGMDLLLGIEDEVGARWGDIEIGEGSVERSHLYRALPRTSDGIGVLTGTRTTVPDAAGFTRDDLNRIVSVLASGGLTVVDTSPDHLPDRVDHAILVVPAEVRAAAAGALIAAQCRAASIPASVVVRHRGWSGMSAEEVAHVTQCEVIAELKQIHRLIRDGEVTGLPLKLPRPLAGAARSVLGAVM